jgi:serine/threonine-protein kinase
MDRGDGAGRTRSYAPAGAAGEPEGDGSADGGARYAEIGELGRGGMGRVALVEDRRLGRRVALKTRLSRDDDRRAGLRFLEEARATAQLEHPSIVPVYDLDRDADGRPFFTMRAVGGRSLTAVLDALRGGAAEPTLAELLLVFLKVCDAVAYAHDRGVLHRDLKPDNVMLGAFGEVFVMDWGLARVGDGDGQAPAEAEDEASGSSSVRSVRPDSGRLTAAGSLVGTPGYMAPEQARGTEALDERADVFALGAILYEMLTLRPAIEGERGSVRLVRTINESPPPPHERAPERKVPRGLSALTMRALARDRDARLPTVMALRDGVAAELEGSREAARRRAEAERKLARAEAHLREHDRRRAADEGRAAAFAVRRAELSRACDDLEARLALWEDEARAERSRARARRAFWDAYGALVSAAQDDPGHPAIRRRLVDLLLRRGDALERGHDRSGAADLRALARQHDDAHVEAVLGAPGRVEVRTWPVEVGVRAVRQEARGPLLVDGRALELGRGPGPFALPAGSWRLELTPAARPPVVVPLRVEPGRAQALEVWIPPAEAIPNGFVYVPGGRWTVGGDRDAQAPEPRRSVELGPFALARRLVTMREWAELLNDVGPARAARLAPRVADRVYWHPDPDGRYRVPWTDADGDVLTADDPAFMVGPEAADAYAAWAAARSGRPLRLPTSEEWEVAARGADERLYPWGDGFDPALCWMGSSFGSPKVGPRPVGTRPFDRSPFGVLDMAGLIREHTSTEVHGRRVARGGAWHAAEAQCRIGSMTYIARGQSYISYGVRLACSLDVPPQ